MSHYDQPSLFAMPQEHKTSDDYWTPKWIFDALGIEFDIDVACPPEGAPNTPCKHFYTQKTDGLASPWWGTVWMNPPFSNASPWANKFIAHADGIALTPVGKTKWCAKLWQTADAIVLLPPNLKFDQGGIFIATMLSAYGVKAAEALKNSGVGRVR